MPRCKAAYHRREITRQAPTLAAWDRLRVRGDLDGLTASEAEGAVAAEVLGFAAVARAGSRSGVAPSRADRHSGCIPAAGRLSPEKSALGGD